MRRHRRCRCRTADTRTGSDRNMSRCVPGAAGGPWSGRRLDQAVAARRQPELLQRLEIELENDWRRGADEARLLGPFQIGLVGVLVVALLGREMVLVEAAIADIGLELGGIRSAAAVAPSVLAAKARKRAYARRALVVDDVVRIAVG